MKTENNEMSTVVVRCKVREDHVHHEGLGRFDPADSDALGDWTMSVPSEAPDNIQYHIAIHLFRQKIKLKNPYALSLKVYNAKGKELTYLDNLMHGYMGRLHGEFKGFIEGDVKIEA